MIITLIIDDNQLVTWPYNDAGFVEVNEYLQTTWDDRIFAAGDVTELTFKSGSGTTDSGLSGKGAGKFTIRNAFLAESQAALVATNIKKTLNAKISNRISSSLIMTKYPSGIFHGTKKAPLVACVSLGPSNGILIFNDFVFGGIIIGAFIGFLKFIIERTKVAEIKHHKWGRAIWIFGHTFVNVVHFFSDKIKGLFHEENLMFGKLCS